MAAVAMAVVDMVKPPPPCWSARKAASAEAGTVWASRFTAQEQTDWEGAGLPVHQAVNWAEGALADRSLWVGFNDRVSDGYAISRSGRTLEVTLNRGLQGSPLTRHFLVSEAIRLHGARLFAPLPSSLTSETGSFVTYDNGEAQIFHTRPKSPFQR